jgi:hypothetical protein
MVENNTFVRYSIFGHLKKALTFIFCLNRSSPELLGLLFRYDHPCKKKEPKFHTFQANILRLFAFNALNLIDFIFEISIESRFFWCINCYQNFVFYGFGYYCVSLLTFSNHTLYFQFVTTNCLQRVVDDLVFLPAFLSRDT